MKITVIGTGYVGLVTGTCFSEVGHQVVCLDIDETKIAALKAGRIPIYEPGLAEMVTRNASQGRLTFTTDVKKAIESSLFIFIAVGTPPAPNGRADLQYVLSAARSIGQYMNGYKVVVNKSTVPVGTAAQVTEVIANELAQRRANMQFDVVSNPEFLREGCALEDFMHPDRVVIGCRDVRTFVLMQELYGGFVRDGRPLISMDPVSAEMTKYAANAMLATKISFINEIANICERVGADVTFVREGIGADKRIGYHFISPGIGYGGSCFPKDVNALIAAARDAGYTPHLLESVHSVNEVQKRSLLDKLRTYFHGALDGRRFAVWGLAFKPETDDIREAPSLALIDCLMKEGASIVAYDPQAMHETRRCLGDHACIDYAEDPYAALNGCDALIVVTEWHVFRNPDWNRVKAALKRPIVFDGRNTYQPAQMHMAGFDYISVGREPVFGYSAAPLAISVPN